MDAETQLKTSASEEISSIEIKKWKLKLTLLLASSLTIMPVITISSALPQMAAAFSNIKNSAFLVKLVLTIPALMIALFSPVTGRLIDRYGRLKILGFALVLCAVAGSAGDIAICGLHKNELLCYT
jgi:MFS family permease